jgi:hypothetical protein
MSGSKANTGLSVRTSNGSAPGYGSENMLRTSGDTTLADGVVISATNPRNWEFAFPAHSLFDPCSDSSQERSFSRQSTPW